MIAAVSSHSPGAFVHVANPDVVTQNEVADLASHVLDSQFFILKLIVLDSKGLTAQDILARSASWALWYRVKSNSFPKWSIFNKMRFEKDYTKYIIEPCVKISPVFDKYEAIINEAAREPGQVEDMLLQKMALACKVLAQKTTKKEVYKLVLEDPRYRKENTSTVRDALKDLERKVAKDADEMHMTGLTDYDLFTGKYKGPEDLRLEPRFDVYPVGGQHNRAGASAAEVIDGNQYFDDGNQYFEVQPSRFATSNKDQTHDREFDYEGDDYLVVGRKAKTHP